MELKAPLFADFHGRVAAVTGGTTGIGRMIAEGFAAAGMTILICARNAANCERVAAEITAKGAGKCIGVPADLTQGAGVAMFADAVKTHSDALHVLVNCAGQALIAPIDEYPEAGWDNVMDLNLKASFFMSQKLLAPMRKAATKNWPAAIINISSIAGVKVQARENYAYAASKAGLNYLTRSMAKHLGPSGITVNAIAPGLFLTELTRDLAGNFAEAFIKETPCRRLGEAKDVADLSLFLASPSASYITGVTIPLDGGVSV